MKSIHEAKNIKHWETARVWLSHTHAYSWSSLCHVQTIQALQIMVLTVYEAHNPKTLLSNNPSPRLKDSSSDLFNCPNHSF